MNPIVEKFPHEAGWRLAATVTAGELKLVVKRILGLE